MHSLHLLSAFTVQAVPCPNLGEAEDVVHKEQHVLAHLVTEVLGHGEACESHTSTCTCGQCAAELHYSAPKAGSAGQVLQQQRVCSQRGVQGTTPPPPKAIASSLAGRAWCCQGLVHGRVLHLGARSSARTRARTWTRRSCRPPCSLPARTSIGSRADEHLCLSLALTFSPDRLHNCMLTVQEAAVGRLSAWQQDAALYSNPSTTETPGTCASFS